MGHINLDADRNEDYVSGLVHSSFPFIHILVSTSWEAGLHHVYSLYFPDPGCPISCLAPGRKCCPFGGYWNYELAR